VKYTKPASCKGCGFFYALAGPVEQRFDPVRLYQPVEKGGEPVINEMVRPLYMRAGLKPALRQIALETRPPAGGPSLEE
jgi:hypothetical protein